MPDARVYWKCAHLPIADDVFDEVAGHLLHGERAELVDVEALRSMDRENLEAHIRYIDAVSLAVHAFPTSAATMLGEDVDPKELGTLMDAAAETLLERLREHVEKEPVLHLPSSYRRRAACLALDLPAYDYYDDDDDDYYNYDYYNDY